MTWLIKLATLLTYPLTLAMLMWAVGGVLLWRRRKRTGATLLVAAFIWLYAFSMPAVSGRLTGSLERRYPALRIDDAPRVDAIVVLGGGVGAAFPPREMPDLTSASDREAHAVRLFKAGKAPVVLMCGREDGSVLLLREWGVPDEQLLIEPQSGNTRENALFAQRIMREHGISRVLLVTSAMHMPRAHGAFAKLGIDAVAAPTDFRVIQTPPELAQPWFNGYLPSASALSGSTKAIHEYVGYVYYKVRGWI